MANSRSRYFLYVSIVMLALVLIGFTPTFYLRLFFGAVDGPTNSTSLPWHLVFHGLSMTAWYVIFVAQTWLVSSQRIVDHRKLGIVGLVVSAFVVVSGTLVLMLARIRRIPDGLDTLPPLLPTQGVPLFQSYSFFFFALFIVLAVIYRRRAYLHKRLMLIASLLVISAAFSDERGFRLINEIMPDIVYLDSVVVFLVLASLFFHDWTSRRKIFAVTMFGSFIALPARYLFMETMLGSDIGMRYTDWLTSLLHNSV